MAEWPEWILEVLISNYEVIVMTLIIHCSVWVLPTCLWLC